MKKTISLLCVSLFSFAVFAPAFAQSTDSNVSVEPMRQALIQVLTQLLHQLEAQLQTLLAQRGNNQNNSFTVSLSSGLAPLSVQFTNTIQSAGSESIDYGDGTSCSEATPGFVDQSCNLLKHTYTTPGTYTAILYRHLPTTELARVIINVSSSTVCSNGATNPPHCNADGIFGSAQNRPTVDVKTNGIESAISIQNGQTVSLSWTSTKASNCSIGSSPADSTLAGSWSDKLQTSGSLLLSPSTNTTYTVTCFNSGISGYASVNVNVGNNNSTQNQTPVINSISPSSVPLLSGFKINGSNFDPLGGYVGNGWLTHSHIFVKITDSNGQTGNLFESGSLGNNTSTSNLINIPGIPTHICKLSTEAVGGCPVGYDMPLNLGNYSLSISVDGRGTSNSVPLTITQGMQ